MRNRSTMYMEVPRITDRIPDPQEPLVLMVLQVLIGGKHWEPMEAQTATRTRKP